MARKAKHPEHVNHERWLVSYADFITLLFATFTALYALSRSDADRTKAVAESLRISFGAPSNTLIPQAALDFKAMPSDKQGSPPVTKGGQNKEATQADMETAKNAMQSFLVTQKMLEKVDIDVTDRGLVISLKESGFFESGKAEMKWDAYPILGEIANTLKEYRNPIRVEGHTDNIPIHTMNYPSNWELSSGRATEVVRLLSGRFQIDPARLSAAGYAEFRPALSNDTEAGRARNRRVDIVVLNENTESAEPAALKHFKPKPDTLPNVTTDRSAETENVDRAIQAEKSGGDNAKVEGGKDYHPALEDWGSP